MKKLLPLFTAVFLSAFSLRAQDYSWAQSISASGTEVGTSISTSDASGNVYITGYFDGTVDFDPGAGSFPLTTSGYYDIFVVKLDPAGNFVWASAMGGSDHNDVPTGIAVDASGYPFITGYYNSSSADFDPGPGTQYLTNSGNTQNIFVCKLDQSGGYSWAVQIGTNPYDDAAYAIALDGSSNVFVTGYFESTVDFDPGAGNAYLTSTSRDIYILKLDAFGAFGWVKQLAGSSDEAGRSIAVDASGNILVAGHFQGTVDFDPGAGNDYHSSLGYDDAFLCQLDNSGAYQWAKSFGSSGGAENALSVAVDPAGSAYVTGFFEGATDFDPGAGSALESPAGSHNGYISKFNATGSFAWVKLILGGGMIDPLGITTDALANVYSIGYFYDTVDFDPSAAGTFNLNSDNPADMNFYIQRLDSAGNFGWAGNFGGTSQDNGRGISVDANYNIYATGDYQGSADFNPGTAAAMQTAAGGAGDAFVLKLDQCNPLINAGADVMICDGSSIVLTAAGTAATYTWNPGGYVGTGFSVSPATTTTYTLTGSNISACSASDEVLVTVNPLPAVPNLGADIDSCANAMTIGVTDDGVSSYIWTSNPPFYNSTAPQTPITQQSSMPVEYQLTIIDAMTGCSNSDTINVTLKETPNAELGNNISACSNISPTVNVGVSSETNVTYDWTSNPPGMSSTSSMIGIGPATPTWFILEATNTVSGCVVIDSVNVVINPAPSLTLIAPFTNYACFGDSVHLADYLTAGGGTPPYTIDWWYGPGHVYGVNPTYTVTASWTFSVSIVDANSCTPGATTSFQLFNNGNNTDLTGHVTTPLPADVDNGFVYAFKYQPGAAGYDTMGIAPLDANGEYNFAGFDNGTYLIKAIADETAFPLLVPTYYGDAFQWDSSLVVTHGCTQIDTADIEMIELPAPGGPGIVSGYILEGDSFGVGLRYNGYVGPIYPCVPGGPLKGIDVKLGKNPGGGIQARMMTDSTGKYEFTNLPLQGYKIYVDIPNLPMDSTREIVLDATNNVSVQNNYYADSASVYVADTTIIPVGIHASKNVYENNFTVFPNPAKDKLFLSFDLSKAGDVQIELNNTLGEAIRTEHIKDIAAGTFTQGIDIASLKLNAGVYFISVLHNGKKYTQRLVVIE